jgi:hypothetical protein
MALGSDLSNLAPTMGTADSTTALPPSTIQQTTDLLNVVAWVAGGGILIYLLWPVFTGARERYKEKTQYADYEPRSGGRRSRYATTEPEGEDFYDSFRTAPRSRRKVSVQFEE